MLQNILITGGCGFIGANFIRFILNVRPGCRVINLDNLTYAGNPTNLRGIDNDKRYRFIKGDICNFKLVKSIFLTEKIDTVVHFAAESHVDRSIYGPSPFIQSNIIGTFTLLEAARETWLNSTLSSPGKRCFLHVSTDEVYGSLGADGYFSEVTPYAPRSPYSASKASSDHLVRAYFHTYGLPTIITNCSNNYGPYQFPEKLIPLVFNNGYAGKEIPVYGDGKNIRDWLYVEDHCEALLAVLTKDEVVGESFNIGGNNEQENIEVVRKICALLDQEFGPLSNGLPRQTLITFVPDRPGHDRRYAINAEKIRKATGWHPRVTFEEGLRKTIRWYLDNTAWLQAVLDGDYLHYYERMYGDKKSGLGQDQQ